MSTEASILLQKLHHSEDAEYGKAHQQGKRTPCLPGTRTEVLGKFEVWMAEPDDYRVLWLNGMAGTGKSTIADSLFRYAQAEGVLGGAYFCSRDLQSTRDIHQIFRTLAFQLAHILADYREFLLMYLQSQSSPSLDTLEQQLVNLILSPLKKTCTTLRRPFLFIVDALDECDSDRVRPLPFIQFLLSHAQDFREANIKFFISSRPANEISSAFKGDAFHAHDYLNLHDVPLSSISQDVRSFVVDRLEKVARDSTDRPPFTFTDADVEVIVKKAGPLFIFASTVCKYIAADGSSYDSPQELLAQVVTMTNSGEASAQEDLDRLYKRIFEDAFSRSKDSRNQTAREALRDVVGTILLLSQPLGMADLSALLGGSYTTTRLRRLLSHMHAILAIPDDSDDVTPVRAFHASFEDHVTTKGRAHPDFYVDPAAHHATLVTCSFDVMKRSLRKNGICDLRPNVNYSDIADLEERRKKCIPGALEYACRHWINHLASAEITSNVLDSLQSFVFERMLRWIDIFSVLRNMDKVVPILVRAKQWLSVSLAVARCHFKLTQSTIIAM